MPIEDTYFLMFSPVPLVLSASQAFRDGVAHAATRMSVITLAFSSRACAPDDVPSVNVCVGSNYGHGYAVTLLSGRLFRLKE